MLILDIWREAGGGRLLDVTTERIAERLARDLPISGILLRRFEPERRRLDTLATAWSESSVPSPPARRELTAPEVEGLVEWSHRSGCAGSPTG